MNDAFRQVAVFGKHHTASTSHLQNTPRDILQGLVDFLQRRGCVVSLERNTAVHTGAVADHVRDVDEIGQHCDLGLVVGGDGTMLGVARQLAPFGLPLIGINQGRLGFITDIPLGEYAQMLPAMLDGRFDEDRRALMRAQVEHAGSTAFTALAMNDVVISRSTSGMVEFRIEVDGHFVANHRADGLIMATPTGSTAYALSAGGPLLYPGLPGWVLVPIAPHTLSNRPVVVPSACTVTVELMAGRGAAANFDMQSMTALQIGDRIHVRKSKHHVRFLHPKGWSYFDTLREKMHWNEGGV